MTEPRFEDDPEYWANQEALVEAYREQQKREEWTPLTIVFCTLVVGGFVLLLVQATIH